MAADRGAARTGHATIGKLGSLVRGTRLAGPELSASFATPESGQPARDGLAGTARSGRWIAAGLIGYACAVSAAVLVAYVYTRGTANTPGWILLLPIQTAVIGVVLDVLRRRPMAPVRRLGWTLLILAWLADMAAIADWNYLYAAGYVQPLGTLADLFYFANYLLMTAGCAALFVATGGSFREPRVWLDGATMVLAAVGLLPFFFNPLLQPGSAYHPPVMTATGYVVGITASATMTLLLLMQLGDRHREPSLLLLVGAVWIGLLTDMVCLWANAHGHFALNNLDDLGAIWGYVGFGLAALAARRRAPGEDEPAAPDPHVYSFLPVLAILASISMVLGSSTEQTTLNRLAAAIILIGGASLLLVRQVGVRLELGRLAKELSAREADARLTELVRRSTDLIAVAGNDGTLTFVSPAADLLLGAPAQRWVGTPSGLLLGPANAARLEALLGECRASPRQPATTEITLDGARGARTLQLTASDEGDNPRILGVVLTARDVTEERAMERAVIEVAARERRQLSQELHEGLGQDLVGLSFLVQSLASTPPEDRARLRDALGHIAAEINRTVSETRALAAGLAPLAVVRDSLVAALGALAETVGERAGVAVAVRACGRGVDAGVGAEHIYSVAREALALAARRMGCCHVEIVLTVDDAALTLAVRDDAPLRTPPAGLTIALEEAPMRLMQYRARLLGATLTVAPGSSGGTEVLLAVPRTERAGELERPPARAEAEGRDGAQRRAAAAPGARP